MSEDLAILVPVLGRPHRVGPLLASIERATPHARVVFLTDPGDVEERVAIRSRRMGGALTVKEVCCGCNYAAKINLGVRRTTEPFLLFAADDIKPHPGWFEAAKTRMTDGAGVVGTQDLCNPRTIAGEHATHFLVSREYAERPTIDGKPGPLSEAYEHNFCDSELIATAKQRGVYVFAPDAIVEHHHPMNGTAADDETYRTGQARFAEDRRLYRKRRRLWV